MRAVRDLCKLPLASTALAVLPVVVHSAVVAVVAVVVVGVVTHAPSRFG